MTSQTTISISGIETTNFPILQPILQPVPSSSFLIVSGDNTNNFLDFSNSSENLNISGLSGSDTIKDGSGNDRLYGDTDRFKVLL